MIDKGDLQGGNASGRRLGGVSTSRVID